MNSFHSIPSGTPVLFDTSILICAVTTLTPGDQNAYSGDCFNLIERAKDHDIRGLIPAATVIEFWKYMNAVRLMEIGCNPEKSIRSAILKGSVPHPQSKPGEALFGVHVTARMDYLIHGALSIVSLEPSDFSDALTITRQVRSPITVDCALAVASTCRVVTPNPFTIVTSRDNYDALHGYRDICVMKLHGFDVDLGSRNPE